MSRLLCAITALIIASSTCYAQEYVPNEVLISFTDKSTSAFVQTSSASICNYPSMNSYLESIGLSEVKCLARAYRNRTPNIYLLRFGQDIDEQSVVAALRQFKEVKSAGLNYVLEFFADPNDYYYNSDWWMPGYGIDDQWYLKHLQADRAWDIETGRSEVKVAIFDTGVDYFHPDLMANIWVNPAEDLDGDGEVWDLDDMDGHDSPADADTLVDNLIGWDFNYNDNNPMPDLTWNGSQHGTMMASFLARTNNDLQPGDTSIAAITWNCKIVPIKVGAGAELVSALYHAVDIGVDIVSMSFGSTGYSAEMLEAIEAAYGSGKVLIASDG